METYKSLDAFLEANKERSTLLCKDYGYSWRKQLLGVTYSVHYYEATHEVVAVNNISGEVEILGETTEPEIDLEGWEGECGLKASLDWVKYRLGQ